MIPTLGSTFLDDPNRCPLAVGFLWPRGSNKNSDLNCLKPEHLKNEAFKDVFEVLFYWVPAHVWVPALNFRDVSGLAHQQMRFFNHFHSERWPKWDWPVTTKPIRGPRQGTGNNSWFLLGPLFSRQLHVCALNCEDVSGLPRMTLLEKCCLDWLKQLKPPKQWQKSPLRPVRRKIVVRAWWGHGDAWWGSGTLSGRGIFMIFQERRVVNRGNSEFYDANFGSWLCLAVPFILSSSIYVYHDMLKRGGYIPSGKPT